MRLAIHGSLALAEVLSAVSLAGKYPLTQSFEMTTRVNLCSSTACLKRL
jgi:hypothetical protein